MPHIRFHLIKYNRKTEYLGNDMLQESRAMPFTSMHCKTGARTPANFINMYAYRFVNKSKENPEEREREGGRERERGREER